MSEMEPKKNSITEMDIVKLMASCAFETAKMGDKTTVVQATLPNGFVIVESSSCVDPKNYDQYLGEKICHDRIRDRLWLLEGYRLQCDLHKAKGQ